MQSSFPAAEENQKTPVVLISCSGSVSCNELQYFLSQFYTVVNAESCHDIIKLAAYYFPDLILMSVENQYCDDLRICEKLQKNLFKKQPAMVMLFGPEDDEVIEQAFAAGADEYIREPIHWQLLHSRANSLIQIRRDRVELTNFTNRLEQTNRELQDFTYVVSHDLQEPLHLIHAFAERINTKSHSVLDDQGELYLERIKVAASRMQSLIDGLLQYSRLTTQAQEFVPVDLSLVVQEVISDLEVRVDRLGALFKIADLGLIDADPIQMRQLFQNLISNALKYSSGNEAPYIEIDSECQKKKVPNQSVVLLSRIMELGLIHAFRIRFLACSSVCMAEMNTMEPALGLLSVKR